MRKVKCFAYHKFGHYARQCPNKKKGKGKITIFVSAQMDELAENFDKEFYLVSCLSGTITRGVWCVDSGASCHMKRYHGNFTSMIKEHRDIQVDLGDNTRYAVEGISSIRF
jgi:hypothetical protein